MLQGFINYLQHSRNYSHHTLTAYQADVEQFEVFLKQSFEGIFFEKVTRDIVRTWVVQLMESGVSARSVNRKLAALSSFYRYLQMNDLVEANPVKLVPKPKPKKRLPTFVDQKGMEDLFAEVEFGMDFKGRQEKMILELLFGTGMRLSELIELKVVNVNTNSSTLKVLGKRQKERLIPLTSNLIRELSEFLELRARNGGHTIPYLFMTNGMKKLYPKFVYRVVNSYLQQVTTVTKKSPHVLRHTFATHMLNKGADLNAIKEILGHANLSATQVYTHNTIEKNKEILKRSHPRG